MPFKESRSLEDNLNIKYGIASEDVTKKSTIIWSKSNARSIMNVLYNKSNPFLNKSSNTVLTTLVNSSTGFAGHVKLVDYNQIQLTITKYGLPISIIHY